MRSDGIFWRHLGKANVFGADLTTFHFVDLNKLGRWIKTKILLLKRTQLFRVAYLNW